MIDDIQKALDNGDLVLVIGKDIMGTKLYVKDGQVWAVQRVHVDARAEGAMEVEIEFPSEVTLSQLSPDLAAKIRAGMAAVAPRLKAPVLDACE